MSRSIRSVVLRRRDRALAALITLTLLVGTGSTLAVAEESTAVVTGVVRGPDNAPVAGARVELLDWETWEAPSTGVAVTGADGSYSASVPAGTYAIAAAPPEDNPGFLLAVEYYGVDDNGVVVPADGLSGADVVLDGPNLTGRVLAADGATPVGGASVSRYGAPPVTSRSDGTYGLRTYGGAQQITTLPPDGDMGRHASTTTDVVMPYDGTPKTQDVVLTAATVHGRVLLPDGQTPAAGANLYLPVPSQAPVGDITDSQGFYGLAVPAGSYTLTVAPSAADSGRALGTSAPVTSPSGTRQDVVLRAPNVTGQVTGPGGEPVGKQTVVSITDAATGQPVNGGHATSSYMYAEAASGNGYAFVLPAGTYVLRGHAPRHSDNPNRWQSAEVTLTVPAEGTVSRDIELAPEGKAPYLAVQATVDTNGGPADSGSQYPAISGNGTTVAFNSYAKDLVPGVPADSGSQVYVRDVTGGARGAISLVTVKPDGTATSGGTYQDTPASLSYDGNLVAFASYATDLVPGGNGQTHIYLRDLTAGVTTRLSVPTGGGAADGSSYEPSLSGDGNRVVFVTQADNLAGSHSSNMVVLLDRSSGVFTKVSSGDDEAEFPRISRDGSTVTWVEDSVTGDGDSSAVHVYDVDSGLTTVIPQPRVRVGTEDVVLRVEDQPAPPSDDGSTVVFATGEDSWPYDIKAKMWLFDNSDDTTRELTPFRNGTLDAFGRVNAQISGDGRSVFFTGERRPSVTVTNMQLWRLDLATGATTLVTGGAGGDGADSRTEHFSVASDGSAAAFQSSAVDHVTPPQRSNGDDVFVARSTTDVSAPEWPEGSALVAEEVSSTFLRLTWPAAEDRALSGYRILQAGAEIGRVGPLTRGFQVAGLEPATEYVFGVLAADAFGNVTDPGLGVSVRTSSPPLEPGSAALSASAEDGLVRLAWEPAAAEGLAGYRVRRGAGTETPSVIGDLIPPNTAVFVDADAPAETALTYVVDAVSTDETGRQHTAPRSLTTPAVGLTGFTWTAPLLTPNLARLGSDMTFTLTGHRGRHAVARVRTRSWLSNDGDLLSAPEERTTTVELAEGSVGGTYTGRLPVAEGTASIELVEGLLDDRHGHSATRAAERPALAVAGALALPVTATSPALLAGAVTQIWSDALRSGTQQIFSVSPVALPLVPADDYELQFITSDGYPVAARNIAVRPGLTVRPEPIHVTEPATLNVTVRAGSELVSDASVVVTRTSDGAFLDSGATSGTDPAELTTRLRAADTVTVQATLPDAQPYAAVVSQDLVLVEGSQELELTAVALDHGRVTGRVTTAAGGPAARAQVTVTQQVADRSWTWRGTTDPDGRYAVSALAGPADVSVGYRGLPGAGSTDIPVGGDGVVDVALPRWTSYPLDISVFTRTPGATDYSGPVALNTFNFESLRVTVRGPNGYVSPLGADGSNTVLVTGRAGDTVEVCAEMIFKRLAQVCESALLPAGPETVTPVDVRLSANAAVVATLQRPDGSGFTGPWNATVSRTVDSGRQVVATVSGAGDRLQASVPGDGSYVLNVVSDGAAAQATAVVSSAGITYLPALKLMPASFFTADENEVAPVRGEVRPGELAQFRAAWRNGGEAVTDAVLRLRLPASAPLDARSVTLDGEPVSEPVVVDGVLVVALGDISPGEGGVLRYGLRTTTSTAPLLGQAAVHFRADGADREESLRPGLIRFAAVTLQVPAELTHLATTASGRAPAGAAVRVLTEGVVIGAATATRGGFWRADITLPGLRRARSFTLQAEAGEGAETLRSAPSVVHYDAAATALVKVTLEQGGRSYSFNPQNGVATFPFTWVPHQVPVVTLQFSNPDAVRNAVVRIGGAIGYASRRGDVFVAQVLRANGRGGIAVDFDTVNPAQSLDGPPLSAEEARASLPAALRDFELADGSGGTPDSGSGVAVVSVPQLGDGATLRSEIIMTRTNYTPTSEDLDRQRSTGLAIWGVELGEDADGDVTMTAYIPGSAAQQPSAALRRAPALRMAASLAGVGNAIRVNLKVGLLGADSVNSVNDASSAFNENNGADKKYDAINDLSAQLATCTSPQAAALAQKVGNLVNLAGYADAASVGMTVAGLVLGPETLGASLVVTAIGIGTGKAMDGIVGWATDKVAAEIKALDCPPPPGGDGTGAAGGGGSAVGAPVWIHDPSGYVYEGLPANRLPGVTATLHYSPAADGPWQVWNADWFGQVNPLTTGTDGRYAWDVPEGFWQVRWTKPGYVPTHSAVLEVLPPHFDVNAGLVSLTAPELSSVTPAAGGVLEVVFDKPMRVVTMGAERVVVRHTDGTVIPGAVTPINAGTAPGSAEQLAQEFRFTPTTAVSGGTSVTVTVGSMAQSYAGRAMTADAERAMVIPTSLVVTPDLPPTGGVDVSVPGSETSRPTSSPRPSPTSSPTSGSPAPSTAACSVTAQNLPVRVNTPILNATGLASVTVTGARPGRMVELQAYSQSHAGTMYFDTDPTPLDRARIADANGAVTFNDLRLASNTRVRAREAGCRYVKALGKVITVRAQQTLQVVRTGPREYVFSGRSIPARPGGLVVSLYRIVGTPCAAGVAPRACAGEVLVGQARAVGLGARGEGVYRMSVTMPASLGARERFVVKTGSDAQNAPGRSNVRQLLIM